MLILIKVLVKVLIKVLRKYLLLLLELTSKPRNVILEPIDDVF